MICIVPVDNMPKSTKPKKQWVYSPAPQAPPPVPAALKREVEEKAKALVDTVLKPRYIKPPPEDPQFNYIDDIYTKWVHGQLLFLRPVCVGRAYRLAAISRPSSHASVCRQRAFQPGVHVVHRPVLRQLKGLHSMHAWPASVTMHGFSRNDFKVTAIHSSLSHEGKPAGVSNPNVGVNQNDAHDALP